jgi:hypothetical protein
VVDGNLEGWVGIQNLRLVLIGVYSVQKDGARVAVGMRKFWYGTSGQSWHEWIQCTIQRTIGKGKETACMNYVRPYIVIIYGGMDDKKFQLAFI